MVQVTATSVLGHSASAVPETWPMVHPLHIITGVKSTRRKFSSFEPALRVSELQSTLYIDAVAGRKRKHQKTE